LEPVAGDLGVDRQYDGGLLRDTFSDLLGKLSDREREVIWLFYFEDLSTAEIAEIIGAKAGAVRTALSRARDHLEPLLLESEKIQDLIKNYYE